MSQFLTLSYYFSTRPDTDFHFTKLILAIVVLFYIVSIAIWIYRKKYAKDMILRKMLKKYPGNLFTIGSILLFLLLARETGIPIISMRIWLFALFIFVIIMAIKKAVTFKRDYRARSQKMEHNDISTKYLPTKKKK